MKALHHRGTHQVRAKRLTDAANRNPNTRCMSPHCIGWGNRTLAEHPPTKTGKPPRWIAGHVVAGQVGGPYQPEVESCGKRDGAILGNRNRERHTEIW